MGHFLSFSRSFAALNASGLRVSGLNSVARVTAACLEGIYIYLLLRFWVFPRHTMDADGVDDGILPGPPAPEGAEAPTEETPAS